MNTTRPLPEIRDEATRVLRRYHEVEGNERTEVLRTTARLLVEAREHFITADGMPDWRGKTFAYRRFSNEIFSAARLGENLASIQSAIRYHVSNLLRERLDDETLEDLGLRKESARDRSILNRERQSALLAAVTGGPALTDVASITHALSTVSTIFARIPADKVRRMRAADRKKVLEAAERVSTAAEALVEASSPGSAAGRGRR